MSWPDLPDTNDPGAWLHALDRAEGALEEALLARYAIELDGDAAVIRRALDAALGTRPPVLVEVGPGHVLEFYPTDEEDPS